MLFYDAKNHNPLTSDPYKCIICLCLRDMLVETVGLLGDVSREQAIASLLSAPLLEDLAEWSQWELVFQPNHGPLKHFIDKYCSTSPQLHEQQTDNL